MSRIPSALFSKALARLVLMLGASVVLLGVGPFAVANSSRAEPPGRPWRC
jgi:hypothetical protein